MEVQQKKEKTKKISGEGSIKFKTQDNICTLIKGVKTKIQ